MPFQRTPEQKEAQRLAERQRVEAEQRARAEQEARARYLASPVGRAEAAYQARQMFFQIEMNVSAIEGKSSDWNYSQSTRTNRFNASDTLGQIEEIGWHLEHFAAVFVETGEVARSKVMSSGTVTRTNGYVEGIYVFRRAR
jgi:hypothetical protein